MFGLFQRLMLSGSIAATGLVGFIKGRNISGELVKLCITGKVNAFNMNESLNRVKIHANLNSAVLVGDLNGND